MKIALVRLVSLCISLIILGLVFADLTEAEIDAEAIVGLWLFDEGDGMIVEDFSGNGHNGELQMNVTWGEEGRFGDALEFPGSGESFVLIPHADSLTLNTLTIMAWVKMEMVPDRYPVIVAKFSASVRNYGVCINKDSETPYLQFHTGGEYKEFRASTKITDEKWHHVATTYDGEFVRFYVDGVREVEMGFSGDLDSSDGELTFGGGIGTSPAKGLIDEVAIFNQALELDDIILLKDSGLEAEFGEAKGAVSAEGKIAAIWGMIKSQ